MRIATRIALTAAIAALLAIGFNSAGPSAADDPKDTPLTPGELIILKPEGGPAGPVPLKQTGVTAEISGFIARVNVVQQFHNPTDEKIEAIYTFPLPED